MLGKTFHGQVEDKANPCVLLPFIIVKPNTFPNVQKGWYRDKK